MLVSALVLFIIGTMLIGTLRKPLFVTAEKMYPDALAESHTQGQIIEYTLVADQGTSYVTTPDGAKITLDTWLYNDTFAQEQIRITQGDTLRVTFVNKLDEPSTIHWHGMRIPRNMDGVPGISQDPVLPGESYLYEFTPQDAGTFWFHPHMNGSEQLERGLYGSLIVESEAPSYDDDIVLLIDDWRLDREGNLDENFITPHDLMHDGRWGQLVTVNGEIHPEYSVASGDRIRVRLINTANGRVFKPVSDAPWEVVAQDGMRMSEVRLLSDLGLVLAPGDRIDLEIDLTDELLDTLTIRDEYVPQYPNDLVSIIVTQNKAELANVNDPQSVKTSSSFDIPDWTHLAGRKPDFVYTLNAQNGSKGIDWVINDEVYDHKIKEIWKEGEVIKVRFANESVRLHPMHLHGQFFQVIARDGEVSEYPTWQDTVLVNPQETVDIAIAPTELGTWPLHCHIQEHADAGMMRLVEVVPHYNEE